MNSKIFYLLLVCIFLVGCESAQSQKVQERDERVAPSKLVDEQTEEERFASNIPEVCDKASGEWIAEHAECEGTDQGTCVENGGTFNECASPCRHIKSDVCAAVCVPVCNFS